MMAGIDSERAAFAFRYYPVPVARMVGGFASSCEAKSPSTSEAPSPSHSERAASAFKYYPASAARISGHFALSHEAKSASRSRAPMPCDSERATFAFRYYPVPVASSSHLRTSRTKGKKHLLCERTLAGQS
ncbi:hypothetical protein CN899_17750 [Bacillus thuringiensis]|uniref:Uncharacterized protein n=1 Tax=Bacillus thuringiensis TaxID=1428 RepID=A0A9X7GI96_BACTU|nr:hypothetical protein ACN91_01260 [Bacillus cereus]PGH82029.1 hypothetical protein CN899_17750 [Bacillus thuringiensis]